MPGRSLWDDTDLGMLRKVVEAGWIGGGEWASMRMGIFAVSSTHDRSF
jgi:hypothetical protein